MVRRRALAAAALLGVGEGLDHLEDGALVGGGEVFDLLEPLEQAGPLRRALLGDRLQHLDYTYSGENLYRIIIDYPGSSPATDTATYTWDVLGRRQQLVTPHNATVKWFYDLDGRLRRVYSTHTCLTNCGGDDLARVDRRYRSYDRAGRPLGMTRNVGIYSQTMVDSIAYDAFGQMRMDIRNGRRRDYVYDLSGNLVSDSMILSGTSYGRHYLIGSGHNRLLADTTFDQAGPHLTMQYSYTPAGERGENLAAYTPNQYRRMFYDALGRLSSFGTFATTSGVAAFSYNRWMGDTTFTAEDDARYYVAINYTTFQDDCRYDALGRRIRACGGLPMLFDGDNADLVLDSRIVYGPGVDDPLVIYDPGAGATQLHYFLTDGAGRLLSYTDSSGNDMRSSYNNVFGDRAMQSGVILNAETFGATGSETWGLPDISFFRNRYFDQRSGTWLTEDPIGVAGGANLYQYVGNNPISFSDPYGLAADTLEVDSTMAGKVQNCRDKAAECASMLDSLSRSTEYWRIQRGAPGQCAPFIIGCTSHTPVAGHGPGGTITVVFGEFNLVPFFVNSVAVLGHELVDCLSSSASTDAALG